MNGSTGTAVLNYIINYKEEKKRRREEEKRRERVKFDTERERKIEGQV